MSQNYSKIFNTDEVTIIKDFLSLDECIQLNQWVENNKGKEFFQIGHEAEYRMTTRYSSTMEFKYPDLISNKFLLLADQIGIAKNDRIKQGKDGIICAISYKESELRPHVDPSYGDFGSFHIVVQTSKSDIGGDLIINDTDYVVDEGDAICFFANYNQHKTSKNSGNKPRIVWIFGSLVYANKKLI